MHRTCDDVSSRSVLESGPHSKSLIDAIPFLVAGVIVGHFTVRPFTPCVAQWGSALANSWSVFASRTNKIRLRNGILESKPPPK